MNRRSFLLGLATIPVAGISSAYSLDQLLAGITEENLHGEVVVMGIDGGGPGVCCAYVKTHGMSAYWDEVHVFGGVCPLNVLKEAAIDRPEGLLLVETT